MDWDFTMDPSSPTTTPVWEAKGKLNNTAIATGRGNTKKLAKNDAARRLVIELQGALNGSKHVHTIPDLAKQLARHLEKVRNQKDKEEQVSALILPIVPQAPYSPFRL
jgi:Double-stranded RNA binding motif